MKTWYTWEGVAGSNGEFEAESDEQAIAIMPRRATILYREEESPVRTPFAGLTIIWQAAPSQYV